MPNPFWNKNEKRVRALWRLFAYLWISILVSLLASAAALGIGIGIYAAQHGGLPPHSLAEDFSAFTISVVNGNPFYAALDALMSALAVLGALWLAGKWLDRRRFADFGFHFSRAWWIDFGFGLGLGALLMALIFGVELAAGWVTVDGFFHAGRGTFWTGILNAVVVFSVVGIREEVLFRAYPLRAIAEGMNLKRIGPRWALLIAYGATSLVFGLAHLTNPNATWVSSANIVLAGILLGAGFVLTGELAIPIGLHISWNFFQGNVFGFPVSGTDAGATLIGITQGGPGLVTGGAFGPEAGLVGIAAMALGFWLTLWWVRRRHGKAGLKLDLAKYYLCRFL
jgi:uncharacterized protein